MKQEQLPWAGHDDEMTMDSQAIVNPENNIVNMHKTRNSKGSVGIEVFQGRLRLRLPRQLYGGNQKYLTLGLDDTPENHKVAQAKVKELEADIIWNRFDLTLAKYRPDYLKPVQQSLTLKELWLRYVAYKKPDWKPTTYNKIEKTFCPIIAKLGDLGIDDALIVKEKLDSITTVFQAKSTITHLNAACKWGVKNGLVTKTPFEGMAADMPKFNYQDNPDPNAFSKDEMEKVLEAFKDHRGNFNGRGVAGISYSHYVSLVEFWFRTGCRPSEAIGLRWSSISDDYSHIHFVRAIVTSGSGKAFEVEKSKNNKTRRFPCSEALRNLLLSIKPCEYNPNDLVFPSPKGKPINYSNFSKRAWRKVVDPIKKGTTPYSCRDTFITSQILSGIPEAVIAKWTDTSVDMIERYYADILKLDAIRPID